MYLKSNANNKKHSNKTKNKKPQQQHMKANLNGDQVNVLSIDSENVLHTCKAITDKLVYPCILTKIVTWHTINLYEQFIKS